jgi:hypothetical protein
MIQIVPAVLKIIVDRAIVVRLRAGKNRTTNHGDLAWYL